MQHAVHHWLASISSMSLLQARTTPLTERNCFARPAAGRRETLQSIVGNKSDEALADIVLAVAGSSSRDNLKNLMVVRRTVGKDAWNEIASAAIARVARGTCEPTRAR